MHDGSHVIGKMATDVPQSAGPPTNFGSPGKYLPDIYYFMIFLGAIWSGHSYNEILRGIDDPALYYDEFCAGDMSVFTVFTGLTVGVTLIMIRLESEHVIITTCGLALGLRSRITSLQTRLYILITFLQTSRPYSGLCLLF